jgi:hypothetical protein
MFARSEGGTKEVPKGKILVSTNILHWYYFDHETLDRKNNNNDDKMMKTEKHAQKERDILEKVAADPVLDTSRGSLFIHGTILAFGLPDYSVAHVGFVVVTDATVNRGA